MAERAQQNSTGARDAGILRQNQNIAQPINTGQTASAQKSQGGGNPKGALMLAKPGDKKLNVYRDPANKSDKFTYNTPLMVRVDYDDAKISDDKEYVKVTEVQGQPNAFLGYALKSSIMNTDVAFRVLDAVGITETVERGVFLANAAHESGGGNTMNESMIYSKLSGWRTVNDQASGFSYAYETKYGAKALETAFSGWSEQAKANYMYGIEGRNQARVMNSGIDAWMSRNGQSWTCQLLGNTQADDGWRYRGRGAIQITGRSNFTDRNKELNADVGNGLTWYEKVKGKPGRVDIVKNPELVGQDQFLGFLVSGLFWKNVCRRRINNTANANPRILKSGARANAAFGRGASVLDLISDGAMAAKVGRMAVTGEYKNINNYAKNSKTLQKGLAHVTADYAANKSAYQMADQTYKTANARGGNN